MAFRSTRRFERRKRGGEAGCFHIKAVITALVALVHVLLFIREIKTWIAAMTEGEALDHFDWPAMTARSVDAWR
jgi:hypothetical protein